MNSQPFRIKTISQFHQLRNLPKPAHPLISVINVEDMKPVDEASSFVLDYYAIALKRNFQGKFKYGQQQYDFDEGVMFFISPGQVYKIEEDTIQIPKKTGCMLLIHPDFLWNTPLAKTIKQFEYFNYSSNEALFLSEKEEVTIKNIIQNIEQEYHSNIDKFSQDIIVTQIETLLSYCDRFYQRQFITRKIVNHQILERLEKVLTDHFNDTDSSTKSLPTVQFVADSLNISISYLSNFLKLLTGQSTQQHIHEKLIEKAKEKLSTTELSISEIAYELGFGHSQSFSKLFKIKTSLSPLEFRQSFN